MFFDFPAYSHVGFGLQTVAISHQVDMSHPIVHFRFSFYLGSSDLTLHGFTAPSGAAKRSVSTLFQVPFCYITQLYRVIHEDNLIHQFKLITPQFSTHTLLITTSFHYSFLVANFRGRFPQLTSFRIRTRLQLSHSFLFPHLMLFFGAVYPFCLSTLLSIFHPNFHHFFS